jgi:hypothetical protein
LAPPWISVGSTSLLHAIIQYKLISHGHKVKTADQKEKNQIDGDKQQGQETFSVDLVFIFLLSDTLIHSRLSFPSHLISLLSHFP